MEHRHYEGEALIRVTFSFDERDDDYATEVEEQIFEDIRNIGFIDSIEVEKVDVNVW